MLGRKKVREEYEKKVCEKLRSARTTVEEETIVNIAFNVLRDIVTQWQQKWWDIEYVEIR